jgi:hypothetical protein
MVISAVKTDLGNMRTVSGRVAGEDQRNSREAALKAVTLEASSH